jgi:hypothetical protein
MATNVRIEDIDRGWDGLVEMVSDIRDAGVEVGLFDEDGVHPHSPEGLTIAEIGAIQEFGTDDGHIPERSWLRSTYDEKASQFADEAERVAVAVIDRRLTVNQGLTVMGAAQVGEVKRTINNFTTPPNAPATIAKKGKNDPLVDSRVMRNHVKFKRVKAGRREG